MSIGVCRRSMQYELADCLTSPEAYIHARMSGTPTHMLHPLSAGSPATAWVATCLQALASSEGAATDWMGE